MVTALLTVTASLLVPKVNIPRCGMPRSVFSEADLQLCGIVAPKLAVRAPSELERGKGGVTAAEDIAAMEVIARIPRRLVITPDASAITAAAKARDPVDDHWASALTAATLLHLHSEDAASDPDVTARRELITQWQTGGWATRNDDLGPPGVRWGADNVIGCLLSTGSDNDSNIYAKFRFPCHPVVHRAGLGLAALTGADKRAALT